MGVGVGVDCIWQPDREEKRRRQTGEKKVG